jgi:hypothetical protein
MYDGNFFLGSHLLLLSLISPKKGVLVTATVHQGVTLSASTLCCTFPLSGHVDFHRGPAIDSKNPLVGFSHL